MKKSTVLFALFAVLCMVSCKNQTSEATESTVTDSTVVAVDSAAQAGADSVAVETSAE